MLYHLTPGYFIKQRAENTVSEGDDTIKHGDKQTEDKRDATKHGDKVATEGVITEADNTSPVCGSTRPVLSFSSSQVQNTSVDSYTKHMSNTGRISPPCSTSPTSRISPPCPTSPPSWRSVSVSTRWRWDDIWNTVNTVQEEGKKVRERQFLFQ